MIQDSEPKKQLARETVQRVAGRYVVPGSRTHRDMVAADAGQQAEVSHG